MNSIYYITFLINSCATCYHINQYVVSTETCTKKTHLYFNNFGEICVKNNNNAIMQ